MAKNRMRSELANSVKLKAQLHKIKSLHLVFEVGFSRFPASLCTNVLIDETLTDDQISFQRPGGGSIEYYNLTDIKIIRRLRTKKWMIELKALADPAQETP